METVLVKKKKHICAVYRYYISFGLLVEVVFSLIHILPQNHVNRFEPTDNLIHSEKFRLFLQPVLHFSKLLSDFSWFTFCWVHNHTM